MACGLGLSALVGCAARIDAPAKVAVPGQYLHTDLKASSPLSNNWYRDFGSEELATLIERAQRSNLDLMAARASVEQADAKLRAAGGALLPTVDATGALNNYQGSAHGQSAHETDWSALLSTSYELDFWGRNRAQRDAAAWAAKASRADRATLSLTISAGVATTYFDILALRERRAVAQSTLANEQQVLALMQQRYQAGAVARAELLSQQAAVAAAQLVPSQLQMQEEQALGSLALLLGENPEDARVEATSLEDLREPVIAAGMPSQLLLRRPDVVAAEDQLRSANADVAAARAALWPSLTLTATGGIQNPAVQAAVTTLAGVGPSLTLGGSLVQTIFDGGQLRAARDVALANQRALVAGYQRVILASLQDVEAALSSIDQLRAQNDAQNALLENSTQAQDSARQRFQAGASDYLPMADADRTAYSARDQFVQYRLARLEALVTLSKALGGGWTRDSEE